MSKKIFIVIHMKIRILKMRSLDVDIFVSNTRGYVFVVGFFNAGMTIAMWGHRLCMYITNNLVLSQCIYNSLWIIYANYQFLKGQYTVCSEC